MGVHDAPQWLIPAWVRTCVGAGATAPHREIEQVGESLLARWSEPSRHYHNARHLADVLAHVDELAEEAHEPGRVRLAAWYHGAVFDAAERASYAHRGGEDVGQVAGVVVVPAGLRPSRQQVLTDLHDLAVRGRRARADAGSDPGRDQPLGCIVDAHVGSVPLGGQRPAILAPATPADITTTHRVGR